MAKKKQTESKVEGARRLTVKGKAVLEVIEKYEKEGWSINAMAKYLFEHKKYKGLFTSRSAARKALAHHLGIDRISPLAENPIRNRKPTVKNEDLEIPASYAEDIVPYRVDQSTALVINDLHIPYHSVDAIKIAVEYGVQKNVTAVIINGDLMDQYYASRFEKRPGYRNMTEEFEITRKFLRWLRSKFPKSRIIFKEGNHDIRLEKHLEANPHLYIEDRMSLEKMLDLDILNIEIVKRNAPIQFGKLTIFHGHEIPVGGVHVSRSIFLKTIDSILVGHHHRTTRELQTLGWNKREELEVHSVGCLCHMTPEFTVVNNWNWGFGYLERDMKTDDVTVYNMRITKDLKIKVG